MDLLFCQMLKKEDSSLQIQIKSDSEGATPPLQGDVRVFFLGIYVALVLERP